MNKWKKSLSALLSASTVLSMASSILPVYAAETLVDNSTLADNGTAGPAYDEVLPDANQYRYQKQELAAFCHFGPNTFNNIEWGEHYGDSAPSAIFTLTKAVDADDYVKAIKDAGFKRLIVTAKHHDGFCIWRSAETEYDVESTPYNNGEGDVLAELSAACTKYDLDMGLYLSPWDIHEAAYGYYDVDGNALCGSDGQPLNGRTWAEVEELDAKDYNDYYDNQLKEILGNDKYGNNGHFVEVWMDGAKGSGANAQNYDFIRWFNTIQSNEGKAAKAGYDADCLLFGAESYTTVRWIGNENGLASDNTWSKVKINRENNTINSNKVGSYTEGFEDGNHWTVPECDARITSGWFWGPGKKTPKSLTDLANMYFNSVGHGGTLLLNVPLNNQGGLDADIKTRVLELGQTIDRSFMTNAAAASTASVQATEVRGNDIAYSPEKLVDGDDSTVWTTNDGTSTGTIVADFGTNRTIDAVTFEEAIQYGQRINSWSAEYKNKDGEWVSLATGTTVGPKRIVRFTPKTASAIRITVTVPEGKTPVLSEIGAYRLADDFALSTGAPDGMNVVDNTSSDLTLTGSWTQETGAQYINGTNMYANPGAELSYTFNGTQCYLIGTFDPNHGTAEIYIDDELVETIDMNRTSRSLGQTLFVSPTLSDGSHTMRVVPKTKATGIEAIYTIDNNDKGMVGIEQSSYTMNEDETINVKLVRTGGSAPVDVTFSPNPGTAIQDDFNTELNHQVHFAEGETEKTVTVQTRRNTNETGDLEFSVELTSSDKDVILGFNRTAWITIKDTETRINEDLYSETNRFNFPATMDETATMYPAKGTLNDFVHENDGQWSLKRMEADWANDGQGGVIVNCFNQQDTVTIPYYAKEGTYSATLYYRSGSTTNSLVWAETDGKIESGSQSAGATDATVTNTVTFDFNVKQTGNGTLVFTGPDGKSPMIDRIVLTPTNIVSHSYPVTVTCGEHGSADVTAAEIDESETLTIHFTPEDGYALGSVTVNGTAATASNNSITLSGVTADTTVEASFVFDHYTAAAPFAFPDEVGSSVTLEAEHSILNNSGTNEQWPLQKSSNAWASNGKFINACNSGDSITFNYTAKPGVYDVVLTYRSGSATNGITWSEADGKITSGSLTAGASDSAGATHTANFVLTVNEDGKGVLNIAAGTANAPQMDKFEITLRCDLTVLKNAIAAANAKKAEAGYSNYTEASRNALDQALTDGNTVLGNPASQTAVNDAAAAITAAINALETGSAEEINYAPLSVVVLEAAPLVESDDYASTEALSDAYEQYKPVLDGHTAHTQEEVNAAAKALNQALLDLRYKPSTVKLGDLD